MEGKASPKREFKLSRHRNQKILRSNLLEMITKASNRAVVSQIKEDGVLRVKVVVRKQDLKQMMGNINNGGGKVSADYNLSSSPSLSVEERLNVLRRKHVLRAKRRHCWSPELQSIPEE